MTDPTATPPAALPDNALGDVPRAVLGDAPAAPRNAAFDARLSAENAAEHIRVKWRRTIAVAGAANRLIQRVSGRNLVFAILIGLVAGGILVTSLIWLKWIFLIVVATIIAFAVVELAAALRLKALRVPVVPAVVAGVGVVASSYLLPAADLLLVTAAAAGLVVAWRLGEQLVPSLRTPLRRLSRDAVASVLVIVWVPFLAAFATLLTSRDGGEWWTLTFLIVVVAVDVGAYAIGLSFGRHPMAPRISPKKTWEGFAGAVGAAVVAGVLLAILMLGQPWWVGIVIGVALTLSATVGDLAESWVKRELGVKDMSSWLPGHGGFLDRLDSMLPSAAVGFGLALLFTSLSF